MSKPFPLTMPFDYDALSPALAQDLCGQADRIRQRIRQTTTAIIETGRDLLAAKERIEHGDQRRQGRKATGD